MNLKPPRFRDGIQTADDPTVDPVSCLAFPKAFDACEISLMTSDAIGSPITIAWTAERPGDVYELVVRRVDINDGAGICLTTVHTMLTDIPLAPGHYSASVRSVRRRPGSWSDSGHLGTYGSGSIPQHFTVSSGMKVLGPFHASDQAPPCFHWYPVAGAVRYDLVLLNLTDGFRMRLMTDECDARGICGANPLSAGVWQLNAAAIDRLGNSTPRTQVSFECRQSTQWRAGLRRTIHRIVIGSHIQ